MSLTVVDDPPDRPDWIRETIRLVVAASDAERRSLLSLVDAATDAELVAGRADDWGLGQVAVHLLVVERGVSGIALRLAHGDASGATGQPRPTPGSTSREGIQALVKKAAAAAERLAADFPADPDVGTTAVHPFYGPQNCFGWLLTIPNHYAAHLAAWRTGRPSAL